MTRDEQKVLATDLREGNGDQSDSKPYTPDSDNEEETQPRVGRFVERGKPKQDIATPNNGTNTGPRNAGVRTDQKGPSHTVNDTKYAQR